MQHRNLVGYGTNPPAVRWPNDARIAVSRVVNYDEGSEYSTLDGDPAGETAGESPSPLGPDERDLANESFFEYVSRVGIWRVLYTLQGNNAPGTFSPAPSPSSSSATPTSDQSPFAAATTS